MPMPVQSAPDARGGQTARGERAVTALLAAIDTAMMSLRYPQPALVARYHVGGFVVMSECQKRSARPRFLRGRGRSSAETPAGCL